MRYQVEVRVHCTIVTTYKFLPYGQWAVEVFRHIGRKSVWVDHLDLIPYSTVTRW